MIFKSIHLYEETAVRCHIHIETWLLPPPLTYVVKCWLIGYVVNIELEGVKHSGCNLF